MQDVQNSPVDTSCGSVSMEPPNWSISSVSDASAGSAVLTNCEGVTLEQIKHVRSCLNAGMEVDDGTVKRFIRATGGNLPLSIKRLNTTLAWRAKIRPERVVCHACVRDPRSHYMHLVGYCMRGRPIIYSCLEVARNKVFEDNRDHMIQTFEWAIKCMPPGVEQWIWVCDFKGFGMADVNPKLAKLFLDISAEHYPERLGLFLVVDAPALFGMLWRAISAFVDPKTYKKIRFLPFDAGKSDNLAKSRLKNEMDIHFDSVTTNWLLTEMNENRDKTKAPHKLYNIYSMYEQAQNGELCDGHEHKHCHGHLATAKSLAQLAAAPGSATAAAAASVRAHAGSTCTVVAADEAKVHNLLGTPALLHTFNTNPDLLLPQATAGST